jgi:transketolase
MTTNRMNGKTRTCQKLANQIRACCLQMTHDGASGHVGSMLSMAELVAVLYESVLRVDPKNPRWPQRDRFVLSKGHAGGAVYAALAEKGFFPKEWLKTYYQDDGKLMGHISHYVPGVEFSTGSLGHGLPVAVGMALAARHAQASHRVFCLMSDGDCDEGSTWEAIMFAAQHKLDRLTAIVDYNRVQALGHMEDIIELEPFAQKLEAFGWAVREIDGHDCRQIEAALSDLPIESEKPSFIIARTTKGKGVDWMEDTVSCHYRYASEEQIAAALAKLGVEA